MSHSRAVQSADHAGYIASAMPPTPRFDTSALRLPRIPRIPIAAAVPEIPAPDHRPPLCMREIERKFLVAAPPAPLRDCPSALLIQGYICHEAGRGHVRVREVHDERYSGAERYLTVKRREGMA